MTDTAHRQGAARLQAWMLLCLATVGAPGLSRITATLRPDQHALEWWYLTAVLVTVLCGSLSMAFTFARARRPGVPDLDRFLRPIGTIGAIGMVFLSLSRAGEAPWHFSRFANGPLQALTAVTLAAAGQLLVSHTSVRRSPVRIATVLASGVVGVLVVTESPGVLVLHATLCGVDAPPLEPRNPEPLTWNLLQAWSAMSIAWFAWRLPRPTKGGFTHAASPEQHSFTFSGAGPLARRRLLRRLTIAITLAMSGLVGLPSRRFQFIAGAALVIGIGLALDALVRLLAAAISRTTVHITPEHARVDGPHRRRARVDRRHLLLDITEDADGAILWVSHHVPVRADIDPHILHALIEPLRPRTHHTSADVAALEAALGPLAVPEAPPRSARAGIEPVRADALGIHIAIALAGIPAVFMAHLASPGVAVNGAIAGWTTWLLWTVGRWGRAHRDAHRRRQLGLAGVEQWSGQR